MAENLLKGQDAVTLSNLQQGLDWYAGYVGGLFPNYSALVQLMGDKPRYKSVAVNASELADILDIENGDATPDQAPGWFKMMKAHGLELPGFYASASVIPSVVAALTAAGIQRGQYVLWVAHYDNVAELELGGEAKQYANPGPVDLDVASVNFWPVKKPAPGPFHNPPHYDWFLNKRILIGKKGYIELAVVKAYDRLRKHEYAGHHPGALALKVLRWQLGILARRVYNVAHNDPMPNGKPSWSRFHRGWRFQQLIHRHQGQRFV